MWDEVKKYKCIVGSWQMDMHIFLRNVGNIYIFCKGF